jgi:hypothetical protein
MGELNLKIGSSTLTHIMSPESDFQQFNPVMSGVCVGETGETNGRIVSWRVKRPATAIEVSRSIAIMIFLDMGHLQKTIVP